MAMRAKDVYRTVKGLDSLTAGQVSLVDYDWENASHVALRVSPNDGLYKGGSFVFRIELPDNFPMKPPSVTCETSVYHPNIDFSFTEDLKDNVCVSLLDEWRGINQGLDDVVQALLFLFYQPNLADPMTPCIQPDMDEAEFSDNVRRSLLGEPVEGFTFTAMTTTSDCNNAQASEPDCVTSEVSHVDTLDQVTLNNQLNRYKCDNVLLALRQMVHELEVAVCDDTMEGYLDLFNFTVKYEDLVAEQFEANDLCVDYSDYIEFSQEEQLKQLLAADEYNDEKEDEQTESSSDSTISHSGDRPSRLTKFNMVNCTFVDPNFEFGLSFVSTAVVAVYSILCDMFKSSS